MSVSIQAPLVHLLTQFELTVYGHETGTTPAGQLRFVHLIQLYAAYNKYF
jgi:hypothetical protein